MLAELSVGQAATAIVAGVLVYIFTSATGAPLAIAILLMSWGVLSGLVLLWSWRRAVHARALRLEMIETARAEGLANS